MLKIKDGLDLKELEKFGFSKNFIGYKFYIKDCDYFSSIYILNKSKQIIFSGGINEQMGEIMFEKLFDLIQAGYIEKVKEQNNEETYNLPI